MNRRAASLAGRATRLAWRLATRPSRIRLHGVVVAVPAHLAGVVRRHLYWESYERAEVDAVRALFRPGDRVLDLGSGLGVVGVVCARIVGSDAVVCVEADPEVADVSRRVFADNGVAPVLVVGLASADPADDVLFVQDDFWRSSTRRRTGRALRCPVVDVDALVRAHGLDTVVCDVEGGEAALLARIDLGPVRKLIVEVHPSVLGPDEVAGCARRLAAAGLVRRDDLSRATVWVFERPG